MQEFTADSVNKLFIIYIDKEYIFIYNMSEDRQYCLSKNINVLYIERDSL